VKPNFGYFFSFASASVTLTLRVPFFLRCHCQEGHLPGNELLSSGLEVTLTELYLKFILMKCFAFVPTVSTKIYVWKGAELSGKFLEVCPCIREEQYSLFVFENFLL